MTDELVASEFPATLATIVEEQTFLPHKHIRHHPSGTCIFCFFISFRIKMYKFIKNSKKHFQYLTKYCICRVACKGAQVVLKSFFFYMSQILERVNERNLRYYCIKYGQEFSLNYIC